MYIYGGRGYGLLPTPLRSLLNCDPFSFLQAFRSFQKDPTIYAAIIGTAFASFQKAIQFVGPFQKFQKYNIVGMFFASFQQLTGSFITPISAIPDIICHVLEAPRCLVEAFTRIYTRSPVSLTPPAGMSYIYRIVPTFNTVYLHSAFL